MRTELSIRAKLFIGFGAIILACMVVALTALYAISSLNRSIVTLLDTRVAQMQAVAVIAADISAGALRLNDAVSASGLDGARSELAQTSASEKNIARNLEKLKGSLDGDKEKALFQALSARSTAFSGTRQKAAMLLNQGNKGEALQSLKELKKKGTQYQGALTELNGYFGEQVELGKVLTAKKVVRAKVGILSLLLLSLAVAAAVATWLVRSITKPLNDAVDTADRIAERDLTVQVAGMDHTETGRLMAAMGNMVQNLRDIVSQTSEISASIATSSTQLHETSEQIAGGAEQVAGQAQTVATASEQMSATSNDIARNCHAAARNSEQASSAAETGAQVVAQTVEVMNRIADRVNATSRTVESLGARSDQIGAIVGTIEDIADQTNLLALNAAIEAARAGEQGRGFAVVADEVRALAERTTKATREISEMIKAIQGETKGAVMAMEEGVREVKQGTEEAAKSGSALQEILDQIHAVSMQVNQIATAAEEQTATISEITGNITQISEVVQRTAQGSQDSSVAAAQLASLSDDLSTLVTQFKLA